MITDTGSILCHCSKFRKRHAHVKSHIYLDLVQRSSRVAGDLAPITQEVFAPSAQLTPIVFVLVFLPAAELGCKSWLPQGYGHEPLPSAHLAKCIASLNRMCEKLGET